MSRRNTAPRARLLTAAALLGVALAVAGCGGGSSSAGVAHLPTGKRTSSASSESSGSSPESPASLQHALITFARCMRSNGVPDFPDPSSGSGGFPVHARGLINSPLFKAAQAKCRKLLPEGPGSGPPPSAQTLARFLSIARCMRQHGVYGFPDPRTSAPPNPVGERIAVISDIEGVILVFPSTIDQQSATFTRAAAACAFPRHNH